MLYFRFLKIYLWCKLPNNHRMTEAGKHLSRNGFLLKQEQARSPRADCPELCLDGFWISPWMETPQLLPATCAREKTFSYFSERLSSVSFHAHCIFSWHWTHWKQPGCVLCTPSLQVFVCTDGIPEPSLLHTELYQLFQPLMERCSSLWITFMVFCWILSLSPCLCCTVETRAGIGTWNKA